jgi:acetyl-CoA carboxylase biotin carboxyl carrier protein
MRSTGACEHRTHKHLEIGYSFDFSNRFSAALGREIRRRSPASVSAESNKQAHRKTMNQKELKELIEFLIEKDIAEFELERGDVKVRIKRGAEHVIAAPAHFAVHAAPSPSPELGLSPVVSLTNVSATPAEPATPAAEVGLHTVRSPIVGTFYECPSPGSPPFTKVGDVVALGQVLCIVEAMKLMNEIEADVAGEIVKKLVANGQPIEYGQELFVIRPSK